MIIRLNLFISFKMATMDELLQTPNKDVCKYCEEDLLATPTAKCIKCDGLYHMSCALKVPGLLKLAEGNLVRCCTLKRITSEDQNKKSAFSDVFPEVVTSKNETVKDLEKVDELGAGEKLVNSDEMKHEQATDCSLPQPFLPKTVVALPSPVTTAKSKVAYLDTVARRSTTTDLESLTLPEACDEEKFNSYGIGVEARKRLAESISQIQTDPLSEGRMRVQDSRFHSSATVTTRYGSSANSNSIFFTERFEQKSYIHIHKAEQQSTALNNPFEVDYDENLNPFRDEENDDSRPLKKKYNRLLWNDLLEGDNGQSRPNGRGQVPEGETANNFKMQYLLILVLFIYIMFYLNVLAAVKDYLQPSRESPPPPLISFQIKGVDIFKAIRNFF